MGNQPVHDHNESS